MHYLEYILRKKSSFSSSGNDQDETKHFCSPSPDHFVDSISPAIHEYSVFFSVHIKFKIHGQIPGNLKTHGLMNSKTSQS